MRHGRLKFILATLASVALPALAGALLALAICALFGSCSSVRYVPVESVKTDSVYITLNQRDSIYMRDSVYVREKGDTVYQYRYKYLFVDKAVHDTLYISKVDSVQVPYPVERELTRWQRLRQTAGSVALVVLTVGIVGGGGYLLMKRKKA